MSALEIKHGKDVSIYPYSEGFDYNNIKSVAVSPVGVTVLGDIEHSTSVKLKQLVSFLCFLMGIILAFIAWAYTSSTLSAGGVSNVLFDNVWPLIVAFFVFSGIAFYLPDVRTF